MGLFLLLQDREPTDPGPAPQGNEHQGGNLQTEILENTEAPDLAQDTSCSHSMDSSSVPWLEKTAPASHPLHPRRSRISSCTSLETCQEFPKPVKVKTEENKGQPQIHSLAVEQSKLNTFLQGTTTDMGWLATPQGSQQHPHFPFHTNCLLQHLPPHLSSKDLFHSQD